MKVNPAPEILRDLRATSGWRRLVRDRSFRETLVAALALLLLLLHSRPLTFWESDALLFADGVRHFDPLKHHPHAPGYPIFIALGKLFHYFIPDLFTAMVTLSITASIAGFVLLTLTFRTLLECNRLAIGGALLFYAAPAMLIHATLPLSDPAALALLAVTFYLASRPPARATTTTAALLGSAGSVAVGCRPQLAILVLPLLLLVALQSRSWRGTAIMASSFTAVSLAWLLPLLAATGGPSDFVEYELEQAAWFAQHDATLARTGYTWLDLVFRFVAHPWGPKFLSLPVLVCALVGLVSAVRRKEARLLPILGSCGVYLAFVLTTNDPADAVRYALPAAIATALLAARGWGWLRVRPRWTLAMGLSLAAYAAAALVYVQPLLGPRHASPSPPVQAARYAQAHFPEGAVILYEMSLEPHAETLFSQFPIQPVHEGYGELDERRDLPVYLLAEGAGRSAPAVTFSWPASDAYGKLTRNHYRVVSLVELSPERRFRATRGVREPDRAPGHDGWRWLEQIAEISLPDLDATTVAVELTLPVNSPLESNTVRALVNGKQEAEASIRRGMPTTLMLPLPDGRCTVRIESERQIPPGKLSRDASYIPPGVAVMLLDIEQRREVGRDLVLSAGHDPCPQGSHDGFVGVECRH